MTDNQVSISYSPDDDGYMIAKMNCPSCGTHIESSYPIGAEGFTTQEWILECSRCHHQYKIVEMAND
jgi:ribosomal protein S27AE